MRFSVVISTNNRASHLAKCLKSLEYQDHPEFEVIVVNGPAEDERDAVVAGYANRVRLLPCPDLNISHSRNIGMEARLDSL